MPPNSQIGKLRQGQFRGRGTGLDSRDLGLVKLGLFSFLRGGGKRWPRLRSPSGMVLLHTQRPRTEATDMQWVQFPGAARDHAVSLGNITLSHTEMWGPVPLILWLCSGGRRGGGRACAADLPRLSLSPLNEGAGAGSASGGTGKGAALPLPLLMLASFWTQVVCGLFKISLCKSPLQKQKQLVDWKEWCINNAGAQAW